MIKLSPATTAPEPVAVKVGVAETLLSVAGGALTALEARSIVGELDRSITEARATGRRVSELLTLIVTLGGDGPPPAARAPLRVIGESETGAPRWTTRGRANRYRFTRRDDDGPEAA